MSNPYHLLEVSQEVSLPDLQKAYRRAVQKWHPDRHQGSAESHRRFLSIQDAYRILSTPSLRAQWDQAERARQSAKATTSTFHPGGAASAWVYRWKEWRDPRPLSEARGDRALLEIRVSLSEVFSGCYRKVSTRIARTCPACAGHKSRCGRCSGSGQVLDLRTWRVGVKPFTLDGSLLRLPGVGHSGPHFSIPGDVWVRVVWTKMGIWRWRNGRLEGRLTLSSRLAHRGGRVAIKTPAGQRGTIEIPPNTLSGAWLKLPGHGFTDQGVPAPALLEIIVRQSWLGR